MNTLKRNFTFVNIQPPQISAEVSQRIKKQAENIAASAAKDPSPSSRARTIIEAFDRLGCSNPMRSCSHARLYFVVELVRHGISLDELAEDLKEINPFTRRFGERKCDYCLFGCE